MCPDVRLDDISFAEPPPSKRIEEDMEEESKEELTLDKCFEKKTVDRDSVAPRKKVKFAEEGDVDLEGLAAEHQDLEKKFDDENMAHALNKFAPKEEKEKKKRDKLRKDRGE